MAIFIYFIWTAITLFQALLGYGTAYRLTKKGADNGVALFGWIVAMSFAAMIPGLGYYLWNKYKNLDVPEETPLNIDKNNRNY